MTEKVPAIIVCCEKLSHCTLQMQRQTDKDGACVTAAKLAGSTVCQLCDNDD